MIGNDIVDLSFILTSTNWKRKGYLNKVFTYAEQQIILNSEDQDKMVWRFWSMKEAAYKVYVQTYDKRFFNPKTMVCEIVSETKGNVTIFDSKYVTRSEYSTSYIYTTATHKDNLNVNSSVIRVEDKRHEFQSGFLKHKVLEYISKSKNKKLCNLSISKTESGVPRVFEFTKRLPIQLSLTHCGVYLAFSVVDS